MSDKGWMRQALATGALRWAGFSAAQLLFPFVVSAMTFIAGVLQEDMPWMWILMASSLAFGGTAAGMLRVSEMRDRWRVKDKVTIEVGTFAREIEVLDDDKYRMKALQTILCITNKAMFPISYVIDDIDTRIVGHPHVYQDVRVVNRSGIVAAESSNEYRDKPVSIASEADGLPRFYATVRFSARYGHPRNEKYTIKAKRRVEFVRNPVTLALDVFVYSDIEDQGAR